MRSVLAVYMQRAGAPGRAAAGSRRSGALTLFLDGGQVGECGALPSGLSKSRLPELPYREARRRQILFDNERGS
jgi:hypothetical protein